MKVAREQGLIETLVPTIEHGQFGGIPAEGLDFGAAYNSEAIVDTGHMFNFYQGRGVDQAFLGFLQVDRSGNVNVSKLAGTIIGPGGFIDIAQRARKLVFCGSLVVRGEAQIIPGGLRFHRHGGPKFVEQVAQVTFSGSYARRTGCEVLYVTEAAVFGLSPAGVELREIAPGLDLEKDILPQLGFRPALADPVRAMASELFAEDPLPTHLFRYYPC
jgi:propionate CoA-transferase